VQSSLVGSILSNILLVLGMCFFAGGVRYAEQTIKSTAAQLNSSLLLIAVIAVLIPSAFHFSIDTSATGDGFSITEGELATDLLAMSHGVAILLLVLYLGYLIFQMWTHAVSNLRMRVGQADAKHFYVDEEVTGSTYYPAEVTNVREKMHIRDRLHFRRKKNDEELANGSATSTSDADRTLDAGSAEHAPSEEEEEEEEVPQMNVIATVVSPGYSTSSFLQLTSDPDGAHHRHCRCHGRVPRRQYQRLGRGSPELVPGMGRSDPAADCE